jgi:hypothetical protein
MNEIVHLVLELYFSSDSKSAPLRRNVSPVDAADQTDESLLSARLCSSLTFTS